MANDDTDDDGGADEVLVIRGRRAADFIDGYFGQVAAGGRRKTGKPAKPAGKPADTDTGDADAGDDDDDDTDDAGKPADRRPRNRGGARYFGSH